MNLEENYFPQYKTKAINIYGLSIISLRRKCLWCHVKSCTRSDRQSPLTLYASGASQVRDCRPPVRRDQDVFCLQIAMHDADAVDVCHRFSTIKTHPEGPSDVVVILLPKERRKVPPCIKWRDNPD